MVVVLLRSGSKYIQQITWQLIDSKSKRSKCSISTPVFILLSILENVPTSKYSNIYEKKALSLVFRSEGSQELALSLRPSGTFLKQRITV